jgi:hypothetical protein
VLDILLGAGSGPGAAWPKSRYSRYEPAALATESFPVCPSAPLRPGPRTGAPFARPGRTGLTMAILVLGVATVTLTVGLTSEPGTGGIGVSVKASGGHAGYRGDLTRTGGKSRSAAATLVTVVTACGMAD